MKYLLVLVALVGIGLGINQTRAEFVGVEEEFSDVEILGMMGMPMRIEPRRSTGSCSF